MPFALDGEWSRIMWASRAARETWEPRVRAIQEAWLAVERASVAEGVRVAALQFGTRAEFAAVARLAAAFGLVAATVEEASNGTVRWVLAAPETVGPFLAAWAAPRDDARVAALLGYPTCCAAFFTRAWDESVPVERRDTTWAMHHGVGSVDGPVETNMMLRWLGIRYVPHLPCSPACAPSKKLGESMRALMPARECEWTDALLGQPMRWSARHGIGEVETPLFTLNFGTELAPDVRELTRRGTWAEASATGTRFPYPKPGQVPRADARAWRDNGFASPDAMSQAHAVVRRVANSVSSPTATVADLGCGNGALLASIVTGRRIGVEQTYVIRGGSLDECVEGDLLAYRYPVDVALLMPGRLIEAHEQAGDMIAYLRRDVGRLVVYAYGDWITRYAGLERLCTAAGLSGHVTHAASGPAVEAGVWDWEPACCGPYVPEHPDPRVHDDGPTGNAA